jgi:hypothetical protein
MFSWSQFERAEPKLASVGREKIERLGFMLLGTIRLDGTPRISPVEVRVVEGELVFNLVRPSTKLADVRRDRRVLLHSPMLNADDPNDEFKLRGRAVDIEDPALREKAALWTAPPAFDAFRVDLESVAFVEWAKGERSVSLWIRPDRKPGV